MLEATNEYRKAAVADARRTLIRAVVDVSDPDTVYEAVESRTSSPYSLPEQLHNKVMDKTAVRATLEHNLWILDGSVDLYPEMPGHTDEERGSLSEAMCDENAVFEEPEWVRMNFRGVSILQACSIYFSQGFQEGWPVDLTVEIGAGDKILHKEEILGNTGNAVIVTGFTVRNPDNIRVTVKKWSLPYRRLRIAEIIAGLYERWDGDKLSALSIKHQGDMSSLTLPYGTAVISVDNEGRRFEPQNKEGLFASIEERQGVDLELGFELSDGSVEYKKTGIFYHYAGGWLTGNNGLTIQWSLADIVGLLSNRPFTLPEELPTTLGGWLAVLVGQLGVNFKDRYVISDELRDLPAEAAPESLEGKTCGAILMNVCLSCGTWPRADARTGKLTAEKPRSSGGMEIDLDNMESYPTIRANSKISAVKFTLADEKKTVYTVTFGDSGDIKTVNNPFIRTADQADRAAALIRVAFGGNRYETTGRGDPSCELGDVDTLWLRKGETVRARRVQQTLSFNGGVMRGCRSEFVELKDQ